MKTDSLTVEIRAVFANQRALRAFALAYQAVGEMAEGSEWNQDFVRLRKLMRIAGKGIRLSTGGGDGVRVFEDE